MVNLMTLRFFTSQHRRNSARGKGIGKWIYLERYTSHRQKAVRLGSESGSGRNTLHRQNVGLLRRQEALKHGVVSFYGLGNFIG